MAAPSLCGICVLLQLTAASTPVGPFRSSEKGPVTSYDWLDQSPSAQYIGQQAPVPSLSSVPRPLSPATTMSLDRRTFLATTSTGLAAAGVAMNLTSPVARAAEGSTPKGFKKAVKIGMVREGATLTDKFKLLKELGFDGIELDAPSAVTRSGQGSRSPAGGSPVRQRHRRNQRAAGAGPSDARRDLRTGLGAEHRRNQKGHAAGRGTGDLDFDRERLERFFDRPEGKGSVYRRLRIENGRLVFRRGERCSLFAAARVGADPRRADQEARHQGLQNPARGRQSGCSKGASTGQR